MSSVNLPQSPYENLDQAVIAGAFMEVRERQARGEELDYRTIKRVAQSGDVVMMRTLFEVFPILLDLKKDHLLNLAASCQHPPEGECGCVNMVHFLVKIQLADLKAIDSSGCKPYVRSLFSNNTQVTQLLKRLEDDKAVQ